MYSYYSSNNPQTFCLNCASYFNLFDRGMECFACGKDRTELVTERQSFADDRVSQRKERVLNTWHLLAEDELSNVSHNQLVVQQNIIPYH